MIKLTIKQLSAIQELATTGSFTVAASNLHTTQSNLSMTIRDVETIVGVKLFDRTTKFVTTTAAGQIFADSIGRVLEDLDSHVANLQSIGGLSNGSVSVGATTLLSSTLLPKVIGTFSKLYPGIAIRIEDTSTHTLVSLLNRREIDLAIGTFDGRAADIQMQPLFEDRLVVLSHPAIGLKKKIQWEELLDKKIIGIDKDSSVGKIIEHTFWNVAKRTVRPALVSHHWLTVISLTSSVEGVCIVPSYACISDFTRDLVQSELINPHLFRTISVASIKGRSLSPAADAFIHTLKKTLATKN